MMHATSPLNEVTGVAINAPISVVFSSSADPTTINPTTFVVSGATGIVSYDGASKTATFVSTAPLAKLTTYTATVTTSAKSTTGTALAADYTWSFTTGPVVATHEAHTLVLKSDETLWGWGSIPMANSVTAPTRTGTAPSGHRGSRRSL